MSNVGYITVPNWERFQHYKDRQPAWIKLHLSLLGNDAWLELSPADRCLLATIWMLVGRYGNGRVRADQRWLMEQANVPHGPRSRNLERLNHAGFIQVSASTVVTNPASPDVVRGEGDTPLPPQSGGNGNHPGLRGSGTSKREQQKAREAEQKRLKAVIACRGVWNRAREDKEYLPGVRESLEREYRHDPSIVAEAIGAA